MFRSPEAPAAYVGSRLVDIYQAFDQRIMDGFGASERLRKVLGAWAITLGLLGGTTAMIEMNGGEQTEEVVDACAGTNDIYCYLEQSQLGVPGTVTSTTSTSTLESTTAPSIIEPTTQPTTTQSVPVETTTTPIETTTSQPTTPVLDVVVAADTVISTPRKGIDISWPTSNNRDNYPPEASFVIVGVNGGHNFSTNPFLTAEASHFSDRMLYVNTDYRGLEVLEDFPDLAQQCGQDENCIAYNYGYRAGVYSFQYAYDSGLYEPEWWLDVETGNDWSGNSEANWHSLRGEMDGIREAATRTGLTLPQFGIYSTPYMYNRITGGRRFDVPSWVATGHKGPENALAHCHGYEFTNGPTTMVQYVDDGVNLDTDFIC